MFTLGMYLLPKGAHAKLDIPRSRFIWEGAETKRKYHMVKWPAICSPQKLRGLGVKNSKCQNVALLAKWIWKLAQSATGLWASLLKAKYFPTGTVFETEKKGSAFWNGLQAVRSAF